MAIAASSDALDISPSDASLTGLDWLNFFLAGMQSGFGPFVAVLLAAEGWTQGNIGFVLSAGGFAGLLSQLPGARCSTPAARSAYSSRWAQASLR